MTRLIAATVLGLASVAVLWLLFWSEPSVSGRPKANENDTQTPIRPERPVHHQDLSKADLALLSELAKAWVKAHVDLRTDTPENADALRSARAKFLEAVDARCKRDDVLRNMQALSIIFRQAFHYEETERTHGVAVIQEPPGFEKSVEHHMHVPPTYDHNKMYPSVVVLGGRDKADGGWVEAKDYFRTTWKHARAVSDTIFVLPNMDKRDYDTVPEPRNEAWTAAEHLAIRRVLAPYGEVQRQFRLDRSRRFLDCGVGMCGFGLRLVTYFPSLFAGLILRHPVDPGDLQLGGLKHLPMLLIRTDETRAACDKIRQALDPGGSGHVTFHSVRGDAPYPGATHAIDTWVRRQTRPSFPRQVFMPITDGRFGRAFWVDVIMCDPPDAVAKEDRPWLHVRVDRRRNQVVINSRSIHSVQVSLNDALVDLDEPVVFVVNGKETQRRLGRCFDDLVDQLVDQFDPTFLYPAHCHIEIPAGEGR